MWYFLSVHARWQVITIHKAIINIGWLQTDSSKNSNAEPAMVITETYVHRYYSKCLIMHLFP